MTDAVQDHELARHPPRWTLITQHRGETTSGDPYENTTQQPDVPLQVLGAPPSTVDSCLDVLTKHRAFPKRPSEEMTAAELYESSLTGTGT